MIRILVVDDQNLILVGIKALLEKAAEIEIVESAQDGEIALEKIAEVNPDVVLLDIDLPGIDGLTVASQISSKFPQVKVIMLSSHEDTSYVSQAMDAGAKGYLLKSVAADELEWSIKLVYQGYSAFKSELLPDFTSENSHRSDLLGSKSVSPHLSVPFLNQQQKISAEMSSGDKLPASPQATTTQKSSPGTTVTATSSTPVTQDDGELAKMEALLTRNHIHQQYSQYAKRDRHYKNNRIIDDVKLNQIKKTIMSFEFKLLVLIILFSLGFLAFVALS